MIKMHNGAPASVDSYVIPLVISAVGIVFTILTLSSFFFIFWWHYLRSHQSPHSTTKNNSKGVPKEILSKIRIISYLSPQEKKEYDDWVQNECSICLGQYEEEEELRVLPNCSHAFHVPCIDAWFEEHTNCPICRSPIDSECCESSSSTFLPTDSSESSVQEQRVFHVIPIDSDESTLESNEFEGVHPVLDRHSHSHSHSHSCCHHMKKKPRLLGTRLKRSLSLDQLSLYVAVNVQREQEQEQEQASASSSSSSISNSKWVMTMNRYKSKSLKHVLMRSFSQCTHFSDILPN